MNLKREEQRRDKGGYNLSSSTKSKEILKFFNDFLNDFSWSAKKVHNKKIKGLKLNH